MFSKIVSDSPYSILLETTLTSKNESRNFFFQNPITVLEAYNLNQLEINLRKIEEYIEQGYVLAGYIAYEAGFLFFENLKNKFFSKNFPFPLLWLGVYPEENITKFSNSKEHIPSPASYKIENLKLNTSKLEYKNSIQKILDYIYSGYTYQVNFTIKTNFDFIGDSSEFYEELKINQPVPYSAFLNDGRRKILSLSPELFFKREGNRITSKPMKGTLPRGKSPLDDDRIKEQFQLDSKMKAENSIIVDLMRNDIGRITEIGSVNVSDLLIIEEYKTLFQMTSTIQGELKSNTSYFDLFKAIFPGGSVTGAPKYKTMQIIQELEKGFRDVYTGAIGFISKKESVFNLPIRTIVIENNFGTMGIGSGIISDSEPIKEFEECLLKQKFLINTLKFELIESILLVRNTYYLLRLHLNRLEKSAIYFGFSFNKKKIEEELNHFKINLDKKKRYKVKLILSKNGEIKLDYTQIINEKAIGKIQIGSEKISSLNLFQMHKTTIRSFYNQMYKIAEELNITDFIFLNENEEVSEGSIYNLFIKKGKEYFTPPIDSGILNGVMREYLLMKNKLIEKTLFKRDLLEADSIYLCNSVRGIIHVNLLTN
ncbi:MAG TPA: aminodeoxychorismate synthase component I [Leptospiraceae bacterium]|nr:aminodeoxychorismate synthase component I [Leptospiraceae bacterium]HMX32485.1 aminodeoxychorismate synthase component I [Leptospiraceae bacterium]HMY30219.1 aminodeoxychorismate synthase component I [Leptospiraceae bacterium]HMZ67172.1 aminodeoxychorismate synthase component I [Leptospiraceae bacterium]HNA07202.1 aminodeoxychorismate synthase component I [Leptospiraceae bacterium]